MKINYLFNPFTRIAGFKSFVIGLIGLLLISYLSYISGTHLNGLTDINFAKDTDFIYFISEHLLSWISVSIFFYISGLILSGTRIRIIDILGTSAMARIPLIIPPLVRLLPFFKSFVFQSWEMYTIVGVHIFSLIWTITLLYNGFKISCNLKSEKLIIGFSISLILSEILTKLLIISLTFNL